MAPLAYYNEIDPYAAAWLRNLIAEGHIAPGDVDERTIEDVEPAELAQYTQCHFFAGIGAWSYALRLAGWPDDRSVWTGSCPCQPFSSAGKGVGFADERHLWPAFHHLISQCRPAVVFGEQVASSDGLAWLDLVQTDLEGTGYAAGAADLCAAGIGAPHIRQRLYWVAHHHHQGLEGRGQPGRERAAERAAGAGSVVGGLADAEHDDGRADEQGRGPQRRIADGWSGAAVRLADADCERRTEQHALLWAKEAGRISSDLLEVAGGRPTHGYWRDADWLFCRDGKWRPVEPGTFPLAHGAPARVGRLRAYGNAIVPQVAQAFIQAYMTR